MDVGYKIICDCGCKDTTVIHEEKIKHTTDEGIKLILIHARYNCKKCDKDRFCAFATYDTEETNTILKLEEE